MRIALWRPGTAVLACAALLHLSTVVAAEPPPGPLSGIGPKEGGKAHSETAPPAPPDPLVWDRDPLELPAWSGPLAGPGCNDYATPGEERARDVAAHLLTAEHFRRLEAEQARLQRDVFGDVLRDLREPEDPPAASTGSLPPTEHIYLFISASTPLETLRNYARDIAEMGEPGVVMVLRGFIGGMRHILPTRRFVLDVLRKDLGCDPDSRDDCEVFPVNLVIDPLLFQRYAVLEVPTMVYAPEGEPVRAPGNEGAADPAGAARFWRISGDAGLGYLLDRVLADARSRMH